MLLGGKEYHVHTISESDYESYMRILDGIARADDRPMVRLLTKLEGVAGSDRDSAIRGLLALPNWDAPPDQLINAAAATPRGVAALLLRTLEPKPSDVEGMRILDEGAASVYARLVEELSPETQAKRLSERNAALRNRLIKTEAKQCPPSKTTQPTSTVEQPPQSAATST